MDATWRSLGTLCRELDWSRPRLLYELRNGLRYRTFPPGHAIDWHDSNVERSLDVEASTVAVLRGLLETEMAFDHPTFGVEVLPPSDAGTPSPPAESNAQWAFAATRTLRAAGRIPGAATKADVARLLEFETEKAVKAGKLRRTLKASYIENQLAPWGIWPLSSLD
jgi:hypothetical protein